ncbi:MAG: DUF1579 family protein, partial [Planctomycetota bacterium]
LVGTWDVAAEFTPAPGAPTMTATGVQVNEWTLGGRWLNGSYQSEFMGQPFEGFGRWGYDNAKKEYVSTWTDSMSTGLMIDRGSYDAKTKTFTMMGKILDPITDSEVVSKSVYTVDGPDQFTLVAYNGPDVENMTKTMKLVYTRQKTAK